MLEKKSKRTKVLKIILVLGIILISQIYFSTNYNVLAKEKKLEVLTEQKNETSTDKDDSKTEKNKETTTKKKTTKKSVKKLKIILPSEPYTYTGWNRKANVVVYDGKKKLKVKKHYTLKYKNNTKAGMALVTIKGKGNYTGSVTRKYYIVPGKVEIKDVLLSGSGKKAQISWKRDKQASGYKIYASTTKDGTFRKVRTLQSGKTTDATVTVKDADKNYYYKVKSYVRVGNKTKDSKLFSKALTYKGLLSEVTLNSPMSGINRNHNLRLATSRLNGLILEPGDVFDWCRYMGRSSKEKGYRKAGVFVNKQTVQGYGGGVCQVSSTIYQACKKAGLNILERHTHSKSVPYARKGEDATVSYPNCNLRIQNNKKYSIKMVAYSERTKTIVKLYKVYK